MPQLVFADPSMPGLRRVRNGDSFDYLGLHGKPVKRVSILRRIAQLAIPPAWEDVWICPDPAGHIQAVGRDARGRKQYRYHPNFRADAEARKFSALPKFAACLANLRQQVKTHMGFRGLCREQVLATVVHLLDTTLIRVGNEAYARQNESFGLSTLRRQHVELEGARVRIRFRGKSGKEWDLTYTDRRIARILKQCHELPGQTLFQYRDDEGRLATIASQDVNAYLRELAGRRLTAKDFRTWWGCVLFVATLRDAVPAASESGRRRQLTEAIRSVSERLGNTPAVCRKSYIDPGLIDAWLDGSWPSLMRRIRVAAEEDGWFSDEERRTLALLRACRRRLRTQQATQSEAAETASPALLAA